MQHHGNFRNLVPLSDEDLKARAPSIFATEPAEGVSDRYGFIPTSEVVSAMRRAGFVPTYASQTVVRERDQNFAKHLLRFTLKTDLQKLANVPAVVGGQRHHFFKAPPEIAQISLVNAHDRTSTYQLDAALWRLACSNGLMVSGGSFESIHVRHSRGVVDDVLEGTYRIVDEMPQVMESVEDMRKIVLQPRQQLALAKAGATLRWGDEIPVDPQRLLNVRRPEDNKPDLWTTFNVVQENLMRGGVRGIGATGRRMTTRQIKSVSEDVKLNRALWIVAEAMKQKA